jgi:hypothetical protein
MRASRRQIGLIEIAKLLAARGCGCSTLLPTPPVASTWNRTAPGQARTCKLCRAFRGRVQH